MLGDDGALVAKCHVIQLYTSVLWDTSCVARPTSPQPHDTRAKRQGSCQFQHSEKRSLAEKRRKHHDDGPSKDVAGLKQELGLVDPLPNAVCGRSHNLGGNTCLPRHAAGILGGSAYVRERLGPPERQKTS